MARPIRSASTVATPDRLLQAAEAEFAAHGYAGARLEDVARRAGIRRPSLLYHFPSKEALYGAVVERSFALLGQALAGSLAPPGSFRRRLERLVRSFSAFVAGRPALAPIVLRELMAGEGPGRVLLLKRVAPLLATVERFVRHEGRGELRRGLPVRAALVQAAGDVLLRAAAGSLREPLWGPGDHSLPLVRALFLSEPAAAEARS